jgi:predicted alpha/beta-hydrolase family hydrolase
VASLDGVVAAALAVLAVLALAYPLLGPGSPAELLATGRPTLVVQGGGDPFGRSGQFPPLPPEMEMVEIPSAHHTFGTRTGIPRSASMTRITPRSPNGSTGNWRRRPPTTGLGARSGQPADVLGTMLF